MEDFENSSKIIIYDGGSDMPKIQVYLEGDTVWLNQNEMSKLFDKARSTVAEHILNIFSEKELDENAVCREFRRAGSDGKEYLVKHYNLDVIISVGYRVKSRQGTRFRQWATARLREYLVKGFTMDDERLKNLGGTDYWRELLDRIRDIRSSEKVFYRQILDIYATSIDYDAKSETSLEFFKQVQNKIHFAVHSHTAPEIIYDRANAEKEFMGLTTFTGTQPQLKDVTIAKNYLDEKELRAMGQIVSGYLDFAQRQAERQIPMKMQDWAQHLDNILTSSGETLLPDGGKISHEQAMDKAVKEYKKYQQINLSEVENAFLESIKKVENIVDERSKL